MGSDKRQNALSSDITDQILTFCTATHRQSPRTHKMAMCNDNKTGMMNTMSLVTSDRSAFDHKRLVGQVQSPRTKYC